MNKVYLIGRLTKEPELRSTVQGVSVATFTLAVTREAKDAGADFINIVVWNKAAENVHKYLHKGSQCAIDGRLQIRNYDGEDGKRHYITEVIANRVEFLDSSRNETTTQNSFGEQQSIPMVDDYGLPI